MPILRIGDWLPTRIISAFCSSALGEKGTKQDANTLLCVVQSKAKRTSLSLFGNNLKTS